MAKNKGYYLLHYLIEVYYSCYNNDYNQIIKTLQVFEKVCNKKCPYTTKDIQSLMNNACGFYCLAMAHFICAYKGRTNDLYTDVDNFMDMFDDLNHSIDWKKNEYILKHFFRSSDPALRKEIEVIKPIDSISSEDTHGGIDGFRLPVDVKIIGDKK